MQTDRTKYPNSVNNREKRNSFPERELLGLTFVLSPSKRIGVYESATKEQIMNEYACPHLV